MCGGKRLRPLIVLMVADALGFGLDVWPAALSVEFFHTASLIADDLPCMDDDDVRRSRPSLHKVFGESVAILASYTLIAEGYGCIWKCSENMRKMPKFAGLAERAALSCLEAATRCAGIQGATNGQFLDLYPPDLKLETIQKIMIQKTVTLFEISFTFGWLFGGGNPAELSAIRECAYHLGMAFQISDDLEDLDQDGGGINIAKVLGREAAVSLFEKETALLKDSLKGLGLWTAPFQELFHQLSGRCDLGGSLLIQNGAR